jgi:hypothetical protein
MGYNPEHAEDAEVMAARRTLRAVDGSACAQAACGGPSTALLGDLGDLGVDWSKARATAHVLAITNATELRCRATSIDGRVWFWTVRW